MLNWIRALVVTAGIALLVAWLFLPKAYARQRVEAAYAFLSASGAVDNQHPPISPAAMEKYRAVESKHGRIRSFEIKVVVVQALGTPWGADVTVHRERGTFVERVGGSGGEIEVVQLINVP